MAVDVITGKPIQPRFEGQRTDVDLADEAAIDEYLTGVWGKGAEIGRASV